MKRGGVLRNLLVSVITKPRPAVTTILEVSGAALIVAGVSRLSTVAGLIAAGVALILIGALSA